MTYLGTERASTPGVLDEDAAADGQPVSALLLRELARTANLLRDADAPILAASMPWPLDGEGDPVSLGLGLDWRVLYACEAPTRPIHRTVKAQLRVRAQTGAAVEIRIRVGSSPPLILEHIGTGSTATVSGTGDLAPAQQYPLVEIAARCGVGTAAATAFGTPLSFSSPAFALGRLIAEPSGTISWSEAEARTRRYAVSSVDAAGRTISERLIIGAPYIPQASGTIRALEVEPELALREAGPLSAAGTTHTIRRLADIQLRSIHLQGLP